jgi:tRNA threonylcarbamoyladenosine biosynthesis protein TsaB
MEKYILHIDTASAKGLVMLSKAGDPVAIRTNDNAMEHASFVQPAIRDLMEETGKLKEDIGCIAVANGPGSYTGLRVGLAAAKGLCYAWNIPLITLSSLKLLASALQETLLNQNEINSTNILFAPLIDARRMEVFRAVYSHPLLDSVIEPGAEILTEEFLALLLENHQILFTGDGANKWQNICRSTNAFFYEQRPIENAFAKMAFNAALNKGWADLVYSDPFYTKAFHTHAKANY